MTVANACRIGNAVMQTDRYPVRRAGGRGSRQGPRHEYERRIRVGGLALGGHVFEEVVESERGASYIPAQHVLGRQRFFSDRAARQVHAQNMCTVSAFDSHVSPLREDAAAEA